MSLGLFAPRKKSLVRRMAEYLASHQWPLFMEWLALEEAQRDAILQAAFENWVAHEVRMQTLRYEIWKQQHPGPTKWNDGISREKSQRIWDAGFVENDCTDENLLRIRRIMDAQELVSPATGEAGIARCQSHDKAACEICSGSGSVDGEERVYVCPQCDGTGKLIE